MASTMSLPVVLTTHSPYQLPSQKFMIPATWRRYQLSQLVNKALSLPKPVPFDFLVNGEILRSALGEWCAENSEETLEIEYIESVMPPEKVSDFPHEDWVSSVSCKIPGQFLTASYDGHIRSFDYSKNATSSTHAHNAPIPSICVVSASDETYTIASASHDLTAQLTQITPSAPGSSNPSKSKPLTTLHLHTGPVSCVSTNAAGTHLLTASWDGLVGLWDTRIPESDEVPEPEVGERDRKKRRRVDESKVPRKAPLEVLKSHVGTVSGVVFAQGQETMAYSCGLDSTVRIWDTENGVAIHNITASNKPFLHIAPVGSAPGTVIATSTDRSMTLYDARISSSLANPVNAPTTFMHPATPSCVAPSTSGSRQQVVSGAYDGVVRLWDLRSTKGAVASFKPWSEGKKVLCVEWEGDMVAVGGEGGLEVWKVNQG
ncbi:ribosome biogenesis protein ytm1 [Blastosporella zonata]|nr:ribosome biogenesis protein ytm1 [Blastosporella zonata]